MIHRQVLSWYRHNGRQLRWRRTRDPYAICVSEIMLHQTQAGRVNERFPTFVRQFPTLRSLARSRKSDVVRAWRGLGYNNRAVRLHELARTVIERHGGKVPRTLEDLRKLPAVGKYTAHAIACFAFGQRVPIVDVNVRRVLSRLFWRMRRAFDLQALDVVWDVAAAILPRRHAYDWNQALLDLGATVCTARKPLCEACPVASVCASRTTARTWTWNGHHRPTKPEPSYQGVLQRHWRGRIVDALRRHTNGRSISLVRLGRAIKKDFRRSEAPWLESILAKLETDGIVASRTARKTRYVALANE